jgi:protein gp37
LKFCLKVANAIFIYSYFEKTVSLSIRLTILQEWVTDIRDQCLTAKVPFFFKQWGGVRKKRAGRILEGRTWDEMPVILYLARA